MMLDAQKILELLAKLALWTERSTRSLVHLRFAEVSSADLEELILDCKVPDVQLWSSLREKVKMV